MKTRRNQIAGGRKVSEEAQPDASIRSIVKPVAATEESVLANCFQDHDGNRMKTVKAGVRAG
jgi:hypothetical protein